MTVDAQGRLTNVVNVSLNHDSLSGFVADEHVAHSGVSIVAGTGLSGGGAINASRTLNLDLSELSDVTQASLDANDHAVVVVDGASRKIELRDIAAPIVNLTGSRTVGVDDNNSIFTNNTANTYNVVVPSDATAAIPQGGAILLVQSGSGNITVTAGGGATLVAKDSNNQVQSNATAVLIKYTANSWMLAGSLE